MQNPHHVAAQLAQKERPVHCVKVPEAQLWRRCSRPKISRFASFGFLSLLHRSAACNRFGRWLHDHLLRGCLTPSLTPPATGSRCPGDLWTMSARDVPNVHQLPRVGEEPKRHRQNHPGRCSRHIMGKLAASKQQVTLRNGHMLLNVAST